MKKKINKKKSATLTLNEEELTYLTMIIKDEIFSLSNGGNIIERASEIKVLGAIGQKIFNECERMGKDVLV